MPAAGGDNPEPGPIDAAYALRAATINGARAVGMDGKAGAIKAGMAADLAILDLNEPAFVPFNSAARQLVFAEGGRAVETVFVAGKPVVRNGKLITLDEAALAAEAAEISPAFRRDAEALASRNSDLIAPLLAANRSRMAGSTWLRALYRTRKTLRHAFCFSKGTRTEKHHDPAKQPFTLCCCPPR